MQTLVKDDFLEQLQQFSPQSHVWVYQADRELTKAEIDEMLPKVKQFAAGWQVHGTPATAFGDVLFGRFLLFVVDDKTPASGCSIDTSVDFVKQAGQQFGVDFFNRLNICFLEPTSSVVKTLPMAELKEKVKSGEISDHSFFFNNTITTLEQLNSGEWMRPIQGSWLA